jgi:hypothetical protein
MPCELSQVAQIEALKLAQEEQERKRVETEAVCLNGNHLTILITLAILITVITLKTPSKTVERTTAKKS